MTFEDFWQQAISHYHDPELIKNRFPVVSPDERIVGLTDAECLSLITRRVFRAGMKHSVVDRKWAAFEEAFWNFDPLACQLIDDDRFEWLMQNDQIIRHWGKMKTVPVNAQMVSEFSKKHGGFGRFIAEWPTDDIVGLWQLLKKRGSHLGGDGGSRLLRMMGKDTFVLTDDVVRALVNAGIVTKKPTSLRDLNATQTFFNELQEQSQLPLSAISMTLALSIGPS